MVARPFKNPRKTVKPGIVEGCLFHHFTSSAEKEIIEILAEEWNISNGGASISHHNFLLIRPTEVYKDLFNIKREVIVLFADQPNFEPESLNILDEIVDEYPNFKIENICSVIISADEDIVSEIRDVLLKHKESQIVIPFSYRELLRAGKPDFIRNRFRDHFYTRDLFEYGDPLKRDVYFFGRDDLVHRIINRHTSNQSSGLFGLRKSGKTSVIYGILRTLHEYDQIGVYIDCQDTAFYLKRWNIALYHVVEQIRLQNNLKTVFTDEKNYSPINASSAFQKDLLQLHRKLGNKRMLLVFDEVERISPEISMANHWRNNDDFIMFWQTMRSISQKPESLFTYLIAGTNPKCIEASMINGYDNPIYKQIPNEYIQPFDTPKTKEMVSKLGGIMGLKFNDDLYSRLTDDFGGHPFLIRMMCSVINKICSAKRPIVVNKSIYKKAKQVFHAEHFDYNAMILTVLLQFYKKEYEMLKFLAYEDYTSFMEFVEMDITLVNHLLGYGIIENINDKYRFKIDSVKQYVLNSEKYKKPKFLVEEQRMEVLERSASLGRKLRDIVRKSLHIRYGVEKASKMIMEIFGYPRNRKYSSLTYQEFFEPDLTQIGLVELRGVMVLNWDIFGNVFQMDLKQFEQYIITVEKYENEPSNLKKISNSQFQEFRTAMTDLEKFLEF